MTPAAAIEIPPWAWRRPDVRAALRARDVAALLLAVQKYGGVSQAHIARAVGMGQGRVNELVNGRRSVSRLDVYERIADGLAMPDEARLLLGLAPAAARDRGTLTGHAEIGRVYADQAEANNELRAHAGRAAAVDVLAARGLGLIALNDSLLRGPLTRRTEPVSVRVMFSDPESPATAARAAEIGESPASFAAGIRLALARLAELADHPHIAIETRVVPELPTWRILAFDEILFLSAFAIAHEGHRSGMYKLAAADGGVLHAGFRRQYEEMWTRARRPEEGDVT